MSENHQEDQENEIKTFAQSAGEKRSWKDIAEVRMFMYVIPVGILLAIIGYILSTLGD
jgi:hypothetical protein